MLEFNGMSFSVPAGTTSQQFDSIAAGSSYSVTVTTQPVQETCTVKNGSGPLICIQERVDVVVYRVFRYSRLC